MRLLRREARAAGLDPGFVIYDEDDQLAAVREAMRAARPLREAPPAAALPVADLGAQERGARAARPDDLELDRVCAR